VSGFEPAPGGFIADARLFGILTEFHSTSVPYKHMFVNGSLWFGGLVFNTLLPMGNKIERTP
jgi:hypothetical protein